jgi:hypothetical protein
MWAAFNLKTAGMGQRIAAELESGPEGLARIRCVFDEDWDVLEIAAMSLAFEDVLTALDLCANATYLASGGTPASDGNFKDLGHWTTERLATLPENTRDWLGALLASSGKHLLDHCRSQLAHRAVSRHVIRGVGGPPTPSLTEIMIPALDGEPARPVSIGVLIPRLVGFGSDQFLGCCTALHSDF